MVAALTGIVSGVLVGYCLQRGGLCFHTATRTALRGDRRLASAWLLAIAVAAVGLTLLYALPLGDDLNRGLAFRPVRNIVGGLTIGVGMVVARTCVSGLFFKLGAGMLGAAVGLVGWAGGELLARHLEIGGPTWLSGGDGATFPGVVDLPRAVVAVPLLLFAIAVARGQRATDAGWTPLRLGTLLGLAVTAAWALAAVGGATFGPSTVGAVAGVADGRLPTWLVCFLLGLILGGAVAARAAGTFDVRGERGPRYVGLLLGGVLLGAGGWIAGGCNLGHGLSGAAQLDISSLVVIAAMTLGTAAAVAVGERLGMLERSSTPRIE